MTTVATTPPRLGRVPPLALGTGVAVAVIALLASRLQLETGGPGVLSVTVPVPALVLFLVALVSAIRSRSFRSGATAGAFALVASFVAVVVVVAIEGFEWMARYGVYALDADPPRGPASDLDIVFDLFTTGMWIGHVVVWGIAVLLGAALGGWIGQRRAN